MGKANHRRRHHCSCVGQLIVDLGPYNDDDVYRNEQSPYDNIVRACRPAANVSERAYGTAVAGLGGLGGARWGGFFNGTTTAGGGGGVAVSACVLSAAAGRCSLSVAVRRDLREGKQITRCRDDNPVKNRR